MRRTTEERPTWFAQYAFSKDSAYRLACWLDRVRMQPPAVQTDCPSTDGANLVIVVHRIGKSHSRDGADVRSKEAQRINLLFGLCVWWGGGGVRGRGGGRKE